MRYLLFLLALPAFSAITNLRVIDATSTEIHIGYTAPNGSVCTVEASTSNTYAPLAYDVDSALFANSNRDDRTGSLGAGTTTREFVIGTREVQEASDHSMLSRALFAATTYYFRITCGSDTATITGSTSTIPIGFTRADAHGTATFDKYPWPSNNPLLFPRVADPKTGTATDWFAGMLAMPYGGATLTTYSAATTSGGWSPTTSTLIASTLAVDSNYATHTTAAQDWIYLALGNGKFPTNSSFPTTLSLQNIYLEGLCESGSANCTGTNPQVDVALTRDGVNPLYPIHTVTLPTSEGQVIVCGSGDPCSTPDTPGDFMTFEIPPFETSFSSLPFWKSSYGGFFTGAGCDASNTHLCAQEATDCNELWAGETIKFYDAAYGDGAANVVSTSCGSSPPYVVTGGGYDLTTPIPMAHQNGVVNNPRWGVLIRKHNAVANTIKLNQVQWRGVSALAGAFDYGSGGLGKRCTITRDSNDFYHCNIGGAGQIIAWNPDTQEKRYLGLASWRGDTLSADLQNVFVFGCGTANDFLWDDVDANKLYCQFPSEYQNPDLPGGTVDTSGTAATWVSGAKFVAGYDIYIAGTRYLVDTYTDDQHLVLHSSAGTQSGAAYLPIDHRPVLVELNYTGNDVAVVPNVATPTVWASFQSTPTIVTPCNSPCMAPSDDYTFYGQMRRYSSEYADEAATFPNCSVVAIQTTSGIMRCQNGSQDSYDWYFKIDLAQTAGTQQIDGGYATFRQRYFRFCDDHTPQSPQGPNNDFFVIESGDKCKLSVTSTGSLSACNRAGNACDPCPSITVDGVNYTGQDWCGTFTSTSSWDMSWGTQPAAFQAGDPVRQTLDPGSCNLRWVDSLRVGDFVQWGSETVKIIQKNDNLTYIVERGIGTDDHVTSALSSSDTIFTACNCLDPDTTLIRRYFPLATLWPYATSADGSGSGVTYFQNHGFHQNNYGFAPEYIGRKMDFSSTSSLLDMNASGFSYADARTFANESNNCAGNGCDAHPNATNLIAGTDKWAGDINVWLFESTSATAWTSLGSDVYEWIGTNNLPYRVLDIEGLNGISPMVNISAPAADINSAPNGSYCITILNNGCGVTGSTPGKIYFKIHAVSNITTCRQAEFFGDTIADICIYGVTASSGSNMQYLLPTTNAGALDPGIVARGLGRTYRRQREAATANIKSDPTGTAMFERGIFYREPPTWTIDNVNRSTYLEHDEVVSSPPVGTATALMRFGYNGSYRCTSNYDDICVVNSSTLNESHPIDWNSESPAKLACPSGCTFALPFQSNKMAYFVPEFYDSMGMILGLGTPKIMATDSASEQPSSSSPIRFDGRAPIINGAISIP